jgi:hypothetical protein
MPSPSAKRERILNQVKELRASTARPHESLHAELDAELAGLHVELPMKWLTQSLLAGGVPFVGFLYNWGASMYVCVDSDDKWLFATKSTTAGAVRWKLYLDSVGNLVLNATIGSAQMYFNWRATTGACKLYDSYDRMIAKDWAEKVFQLYNPNNQENIGTWSTSDKELYNRTNVSYKEFGFQFFDEDSFTEDDHLIYDAYMKSCGSVPQS